MKKDQLFKAAAIIAVATVLSKVLGYAREVAMAAVFGATRATDAYLVASIIPNMLLSVVSVALATTLIPVFTRRVHEDGEGAGLQFINSLINFIFIFCLIMAGIGIFDAPLLVRVIAPGFKGETFALTVSLTRVLMPTMVFVGLAAVVTGFLQARESFTWPALVGIPSNIILISAIIWGGRRYGITAVAMGMVLAILSQLFFMAPSLKKGRFRYRFFLNIHDPGMVQVGKLVIPILLATGAGQLGLIVDRMLASGLSVGSIAALNYGNLVTSFPLGIFSLSIMTVLYPTFSKYSAVQDFSALRRTLTSGVRATLFLILPMSVALIVLREPVVHVLFERGAFNSRATNLTAYAVLFFSMGLVPMALRDLISRVYFSLQDTMTPMLLGIGSVAVNIGLNFLLIKPLAHGGLALSTSLAALVACFILFAHLRRRIGGINGSAMLDGFWRVSVASLVMGVGITGAWMVFAKICAGRGLIINAGCLAVTIFFGAVIYILVSFYLRLPEVGIIFNFARNMADRLRARFSAT
jgi:putative peptidoglycan lipid II flippase